MLFSLNAEEVAEEEYDIEEDICENEKICVPEPQRGYARRYCCPHRYRDYYYYEDKDIDATWPGKIENSFIDELRR